MAQQKLRVAVIFGGVSSEHEISLRSAASVLSNLSSETYELYKIGITRDGAWLLYSGNAENIEDGSWVQHRENVCAILSPDRETHGLLVLREGKTEKLPVDVIFPVLHGKNGEDGTIQGLFQLSGIPYVGCGTLSSAVCMDKAVTHSLLAAANIEQAQYLWFYADRYRNAGDAIKTKIEARLTFPVFVKPANAGSSVGVSRVETPAELDAAIEKAAKEDSKIVVENGITGQEIECAVMGNRDAIASPVGEIGASAAFYDYTDKYVSGTAQLFIPARIPQEAAERVQEIAVRAYRLLGCSGLARVDFFYTDTGEIILNEINTLPGFTSISMYPKLWMNHGLSYAQILDRLISYAFEKDTENHD